MPAARDVAVGEFVHQRQRRAARQQRIEVHFLQHAALVLDAPPWQHLQPGQQHLGLGATMGLDDADDDLDALASPCLCIR